MQLPLRRASLRILTIALTLAAVHCGGGPSSAPTAPNSSNTGPPGVPGGPTVPVPGPPQIFAGAGDIGWCGLPGAEQTGRLLDGLGGTVFTAGDNAYMSGSAQDFANCYDPFWGRHKSYTRPVPGNHEYQQVGAAPYFNYFGNQAGPPGVGYYSFDLGDAWHVVALNSLIDVNGGSAQASWLRADLAANTKPCTLAYWHFPLFSSGPNGGDQRMREFWQILYEFNAEIVVNGHEHLYERFAPQTADGVRDDARGIREFIAGTGGARLYDFVTTRPNSERQISRTYGVLKFTLTGDGYDWTFIPVSGPSDSGTGRCH